METAAAAGDAGGGFTRDCRLSWVLKGALNTQKERRMFWVVGIAGEGQCVFRLQN